MAQIRGELLLLLADAAQRLRGYATPAASGWEGNRWYSSAALQGLLDEATCGVTGALERLGEECGRIWAERIVAGLAPKGPADWLQAYGQASLFRPHRGSAATANGLLALNVQHGEAVLAYGQLLPQSVQTGWLQGVLAACSTVLYVDVAPLTGQARAQVRFVTAANRTTLAWAGELGEQEWRCRYLQGELQRREQCSQALAVALEQAATERSVMLRQLHMQERLASLGSLTAGLAHEINNPANFAYVGAQSLAQKLTCFRQFLVELAGGDASPEVLVALDRNFNDLEASLATVLDGTGRVRELARDLRQFTRSDPLEKTPIPVASSLKKTVELVRTQYAAVTDFVCELDPRVQLLCWPAQLNQVCMNLVVNACQAIERKQRTSRCGTRGSVRISSRIDQDMLQLEFADDGCGIPATLTNKIFEPFFSTRADGEGTGLGLSISQGIVAAHGGTLSVHSREDEGSRFIVRLPLATSSPG